MAKVKLTPEQKQANRDQRKVDRLEAKKAAIIEAEKTQKEVAEITISIEWKKSLTFWNAAPCAAFVRFKDGTGETSPTFTASGCGYDKESTVIADVFNTYLKYKLYKNLPIGEVKSHVTRPRDNGLPYGITQREDYKSYNGGIGTNCYYAISEAIGGKFERVASGKTYDAYKYSE